MMMTIIFFFFNLRYDYLSGIYIIEINQANLMIEMHAMCLLETSLLNKANFKIKINHLADYV